MPAPRSSTSSSPLHPPREVQGLNRRGKPKKGQYWQSWGSFQQARLSSFSAQRPPTGRPQPQPPKGAEDLNPKGAGRRSLSSRSSALPQPPRGVEDLNPKGAGRWSSSSRSSSLNPCRGAAGLNQHDTTEEGEARPSSSSLLHLPTGGPPNPFRGEEDLDPKGSGVQAARQQHKPPKEASSLTPRGG